MLKAPDSIFLQLYCNFLPNFQCLLPLCLDFAELSSISLQPVRKYNDSVLVLLVRDRSLMTRKNGWKILILWLVNLQKNKHLNHHHV